MKISFSEIASRITGFSTPVFGISWNPPESERKIVKDVIVFLEDRRALYNPFVYELEHEVAQSVIEIRKVLTDAIQRLPEDSQALFALKAMRTACREYLDSARRAYGPEFAFMVHLGRLRTIFGYHISHLAVNYGIDIEGELTSIIPPEYSQASHDDDVDPPSRKPKKK